MTFLLVAILIVAISMALIAIFMMWLVEKMTTITFTQRFQDAEYILNHHQPPESWATPLSPFVRFMQGAGVGNFGARLRHAFAKESNDSQVKERLLNRLDDLIDFFETCPFFQDEGSRDIMMNQLWDERDRWAEQNRYELYPEHGDGS